MGLFDNFFKSKSPPSEENSVETGAKPEDPAKRSDTAAARSTPPHRADPSAFLHPKSFVPRTVSPLGAPTKSVASTGVRKPGGTAAPAPAEEIVLTLGDVLSRIPSHYLKAGQHDAKREMRFSINDLSSDIARGRAAVPLSRIAQLMPDIFVREITRDEDTEVRLPLQKLVEQIGLLRSRPLGSSSDKTSRPAAGATSLSLPAPDVKAHFPEPMVEEVAEPARETLRDLFVDVDSTFAPASEAQPSESAPASVPSGLEPTSDLQPVAEQLASEIPLPASPPAPTHEVPTTPAPSVIEPVGTAVEEVAVTPAVEEAVVKAEAALEEPAPPTVIESAPPVVATPPLPRAEVPPEIPSETILPPSPIAVSVIPSIPERVVQESFEPEDVDDEKIQLSLAAILRQCPPEIIVGELPAVPDNVRITLPFAPIDRQLVMGHVEISAVRFVAALPFSYQKYFTARMGVNVPIPLEEVFQNLPSSLTEEPEMTGPPLQFLAPAALDSVSPTPIPADVTHPGPTPTEGTGATTAVPPEAPAAEESGASVTSPIETVSTAPQPPLDLPAFHHFMRPPPVVVPDHIEPTTLAAIVAPEPPPEAPLADPAPIEPETDEMTGEIIPPSPAGADFRESPSEAEIVSSITDLPEPMSAISELPVVESPVESPVDWPSETQNASDQPAPVPSEPGEAAEDRPLEVDGSAPPNEPNSPSVFAEANQTIQPPRMVRPFIVLPPPILGFNTSPSLIESNETQAIDGEGIGGEFTVDENSLEAMAPEMEARHQVVPPEPKSGSPDLGAPADLADGDAADPAVLASIISIDFSEALVSPDEAKAGVEFPVVEVGGVPPHTPEGPTLRDKSGEEPGIAAEPVGPVWESITPPAMEIGPPSVGDEASALPDSEKPLEKPLEAPLGAITLIVAGHFMEPLPEPVAPPESKSVPKPIMESVAEPAAETVEPVAAVEVTPMTEPPVAPLLKLPRFVPEHSHADILPPALPLRRFNQDALQALFLTEEILDLTKISRLAAQLPGVHACVIATRDQACTGGTLPEGFDLAALLGLAPRVGEAAGRMPIGALKHFTLYGEQYSVSFFERNGLSLCAVHRPRSFVPGVREKLVAIADELSK